MPIDVEKVKDHLKISSNREDDRLIEISIRGEKLLNRLTGTTLDFEKEDLPQQLLLDYCRYAYNDSMEYFQVNFASDILHLQLSEAVSEEEADGTS